MCVRADVGLVAALVMMAGMMVASSDSAEESYPPIFGKIHDGNTLDMFL